MATDISLTWQPPRVNLQRLFELRNLALVGQCATIAVASLWLGIVLPLSALGLVVALLACSMGSLGYGCALVGQWVKVSFSRSFALTWWRSLRCCT